MKITDIQVRPVEGDQRFKAYVTAKLDGCFVIRDMKVIDGHDGFFVAMPAKKMKDGSYRDIVHPLDLDTRTMFESQIIGEYKKVRKAYLEGAVVNIQNTRSH